MSGVAAGVEFKLITVHENADLREVYARLRRRWIVDRFLTGEDTDMSTGVVYCVNSRALREIVNG
jgi:hypothetical protein